MDASGHLPRFLVSLWELYLNLQQVPVGTGRCVFMSPVIPEKSLNTFFAHSCPSSANCPWHADSVVYTKVQPSKFVPASRIELSCASCLLPGCYFPQNVCCPSSKVDCVVVCGEMQRVLLAAELEHCLGYPRGHNASLVITIDQVDLSHVELHRMAILQSADPVLPMVTVLLSHCHVQDFKRASQLQSCANRTWMVHSMCERVEKMRAEVPYLQDRISRKLSVTGTMGPDEIEENFHATAACSDLVQPQHALRQLDIPVCFQEACHLLRTPCSAQLPDDLDFAVRRSAGLCPGVPFHSVKNAFGNTSTL